MAYTKFSCALLLQLLLLMVSVVCTSAFSPIGATQKNANKKLSTSVFMAPKWDGEKWVPTSPEEGPEAGYGPGKTLLLQGPKPFLTRIFQPQDYEQAVLKFMAGDKCSRDEAQGNMDLYLA
jgi:hypothetical protein